MADFDVSETNYDDFLLSNFFDSKSKSGKNESNNNNDNSNEDVQVEIVDRNNDISGFDNENLSLNQDSVSYEQTQNASSLLEMPKSDDNGLVVVKTDVIRHKAPSCDRCEPLTLQIALSGIEKNKQIKKAIYADNSKNKSKCCNNKSQAKGKRSKGRKFAIVLLVIVFAFVSCFLIADVLSDGYLINTFTTKLFKGDNQDCYYAVEIATFNDVDAARMTSEEIRASGGSGYVVHDELYRVIAEVYKTEKDAESVMVNLNLAGYVTNLYLFKIENIDYKLLPKSVRNTTKNVLKYQGIMYESLYNTAVSLEKKEIDYTSAREDIGMLSNQISNMLIDYESSVNNQINNKYVQKVRQQISSMIGALANLTAEGSKNDRLLSDIRYINTMILNTHRALIKSLQSE